MKIFGLTITTAAIVAASASLSHVVAATAEPGNPVGDAAISTATALENTKQSGAEKKAAVVAAITPLIVQAATKGGLAALEVDAEKFAGLVVEEVVANLKPTPLVQLAKALLAVFGIKVLG
ncbi:MULTISPECIES: hypothetical protein [unclassified Sphingomonas]|uniref:hypothetical protein n=1 Tax=unclassified Sphingomonas TaxID=196159 RepID=UPI002269A59B|nr:MULTISPECIES: hypothetical protein [unclassified Sphingomonas]